MSLSTLFAKLFKLPFRLRRPSQSQGKGRRQRLFFALCPDEHTREELTEVLAMFPRQLSERWIRPANFHITLASFRSGGSDSWIGAMKAAADRIDAVGAELVLDRITYRPDVRTLRLTPSVVPPPLEKLAADLVKNLDSAGFDVEVRPFRGQVTLARQATYPSPGTRLARAVHWKAASFALIRARSDGLGTLQEVIATWPLSMPPEPEAEPESTTAALAGPELETAQEDGPEPEDPPLALPPPESA